MADLKKVVDILKENNVSEEDRAKFIMNLNNVIAQQVEIELVTALGEEDFKKLNSMDEATAHAEISRRYKEITGTSIEQKTDQMVEGFITGFLAEYNKQKSQGKA